MPNFAVLDGLNVINTILADSKEIAENVTGKICIEYTDEPAEVGGTYENNVFIPKKPYPSWILTDKNLWAAPIPQPIKLDAVFIWDEPSLSWVEKV